MKFLISRHGPAKAIPPLLLALAGSSTAAPLYTAPFGPDGTWNLYQPSSRAVTWDQARHSAAASKVPGFPDAKGHLVTFSSMAENQFARSISAGSEVWIGLSDDERFGGMEAGSNPRDGWKWLDGGALTFSNWKPVEPDNWNGQGPGEDAVFYDWSGRWRDVGSGIRGQHSSRYRYLTEWETRSETPVQGAISLTPVWRSTIEWPKYVPGKWSARWASGFLDNRGTKPLSTSEAAALLAVDAKGRTVNGRRTDSFAENLPEQGALLTTDGSATSSNSWLWLATSDSHDRGWMPPVGPQKTNFSTLPRTGGYIGAIVGKVHVDKPGTYTFSVLAEDAFALRVGDLKWKSASGDGYVDPLDPLTFTQPNPGLNSKALGIIDLPAGDHLIRGLWMVRDFASEFCILAAPGAFTTEGATTNWRPLGYQVLQHKIPRLGITAAGWTLDYSKTPSKPHPTPGLQDALIQLQMDLGMVSKTGSPSINFADAPATNPARFPEATTFPNWTEGIINDGWAMRATARLVVPQDGTYQVGLHTQGKGALRIKNGQLLRVSQSPEGLKGVNQQRDTVDFNGRANDDQEPKLVTEWDLKMGEYDIEVFYLKDIGPASFAVFSSPSGPYPPALLTAGAAALTDDAPGLPLATP